jgi:hypothetical protein
MMAKEDQTMRGVIVLPVVALVRRCHTSVIDGHDPGGDECAVIAIGDGQDAENRQDEVKRAHSGAECIKMTGTSIARGPLMAKIRASVTGCLPVVLLLSLVLFAPAQAAAQGGYFGRNKVQYRDFKFQVLKTEHFDIHFYRRRKPQPG